MQLNPYLMAHCKPYNKLDCRPAQPTFSYKLFKQFGSRLILFLALIKKRDATIISLRQKNGDNWEPVLYD
ncbi:hypothetical protein IGI49_003952 [Enterococcus sp. AZ071]